jgi:hypothetical protein
MTAFVIFSVVETVLSYSWLALLVLCGVLALSVLIGVATRNKASWVIARIVAACLLVLVVGIAIMDGFGLH